LVLVFGLEGITNDGDPVIIAVMQFGNIFHQDQDHSRSHDQDPSSMMMVDQPASQSTIASYDAPTFGLQLPFPPTQQQQGTRPRLTIQIPDNDGIDGSGIRGARRPLASPMDDSHSTEYEDLSDESQQSPFSAPRGTSSSLMPPTSSSSSPQTIRAGSDRPTRADKKRKQPDSNSNNVNGQHHHYHTGGYSSIVPLSPSWGHPQIRTRFTLGIVGLPVKSRVETQIKMCLKLADDASPGQLARDYSSIIVDSHLLAPAVGRRRAAAADSLEEEKVATQETHLRLECHIVASMDPSKEIYRCANCIQRERRSLKRKTKSELPEEQSMDEEKRKIIQFYTHRVVDFSAGEAVLPVRITCYCRHHKEATGFGIVVTLIDGFTHQIVASTLSSWIMITDDHKSQNRPNKKAKRGNDDLTDAASSPNSLLLPPQPRGYPLNSNHNPFLGVPIASSPSGDVSPMLQVHSTPPDELVDAEADSHSSVSSPVAGPPTPFLNAATEATSIGDGGQVGTSASLFQHQGDGGFMLDDLSGDGNSSSSFSPMPHSPSPPPIHHQHQHQHQSHGHSHHHRLNAPGIVEKAVPSEGPMSGGMEVTILGQSLLPAHRVFFGASQATILQYWGPNALVALLPASATPTTVPVFVMGPNETHLPSHFNQEHMGSFTYHDETDRQLLELALQILGMKLTGKLEDAKKIAMDIVARSRQHQQQQQHDGSESGSGNGNGNTWGQRFASSSTTSSPTEELIVATFVALHQGRLQDFVTARGDVSTTNGTDTPSHSDNDCHDRDDGDSDEDESSSSSFTASSLVNLSLANSFGQTVLHLAALKNYVHLIEVVLALARLHPDTYDLDVDAMDANGFTPLHFAAVNTSLSCVRLLRSHSANIEINDEQGRTPIELIPVSSSTALLREALTNDSNGPAGTDDIAHNPIPINTAKPATTPSVAPRRAGGSPPVRGREGDKNGGDDDNSDNADIEYTHGRNVEIFMDDDFTNAKEMKQQQSYQTAAFALAWILPTAQRLWREYKFAFYISALIVCFSTMLVETLPYNFNVGVMRSGSPLTSSNPSIISNKDNPKPYTPFPETSSGLWSLYFLLRLGLVCAVMLGLLVHYRPAPQASRFSHLAFWAGVGVVFIVFVIGVLHILGMLVLF
jgi:hypothetical protein